MARSWWRGQPGAPHDGADAARGNTETGRVVKIPLDTITITTTLLYYMSMVVAVVVVVLTLSRIIKSVVTGRAPGTLEQWKNAPGEK